MPGCTEEKPNTPQTVAQAFWTATLKGDTETAKQFLTPESRPNFKFILQNPKDFIELGEQSITTTQAQILTQLTRHKANQQQQTSLRTILVNQNGQWLVDFDQTRDSMLGSELQSVIEQLSNTMRETIDKGVKVMGESVKDELQQMERSLQEGLEEMNRELEKQNKNKQPPETTTL
ncbi:MAG: hypothetical protein KZQ64_08990 [gamma proteobacterium symbiont of Bathyaustriella thionipta]|nr:hypothetical protein [gamma proteobacterium symbiont of Bathyaustriella thionipta]MCU7951029.1 hypothetical protein [gamma proteobacterium symbiont of Bathyaustriella thionipta]MCU7953509.1 hypothetical protein [gamma proteobacterium symbiont of Bathyaustriella thionipta]MCU7957535.1 hypothetical protein [gamma proteobacterium symbiont of Bathyaustriella thionipta]MCU7969014.1 hypothetical protein [gamma proteobacterium symbiont of Bathyaustriella thionipta]